MKINKKFLNVGIGLWVLCWVTVAFATGISKWKAGSAITDADLIAGTAVADHSQSLNGTSVAWTGAQLKAYINPVYGPSSVTDSDVVLFDTTTGKLIKSGGQVQNISAGKGITFSSGVISVTPALPTGTIVGTSDSQALTNKTSQVVRVDAYASGALAAESMQTANIGNCSVTNAVCQGATTPVEMTTDAAAGQKVNIGIGVALTGGTTWKLTLATRYIYLNGVKSTGHSLIFTNPVIGDHAACTSFATSTTTYDLFCDSPSTSVTAP